MRRIIRKELTKDIQKYLARKQEEVAATDADDHGLTDDPWARDYWA